MVPSFTGNPLCVINKDLTENFVLLEHAVFMASVPLNCIALWCIYTDKSTRIKWYLLNCQLWYILNDACFAVLSTPVTLLPFVAVYSYGVLNYLGISIEAQVCIIVAALSGMVTSILHLFFHRHQTLISTDHRRHMPRKFKIIFITFVYVYYGFQIPILFYFIFDDDKIGYLRSYAPNYPCLYPELYEDGVAVINRHNINFLVGYAAVYIFSWIAIVFFLAGDSFNALRVRQTSMSRATRDHIRRSLTVLLIVISFLGVPIFICVYEIITKSYAQVAVLVSICFVSFHASAGTLAAICLNKKYRANLSKKLSLYKTPIKLRLAWATTASRSIGPVQNSDPN